MPLSPTMSPQRSAAERLEACRTRLASLRRQSQRLQPERLLYNLERSAVPDRDILVPDIAVAFKKEFFKRAKIQLDDNKLLDLAEKIAHVIVFKYGSLPPHEQDTCCPDFPTISVIVSPLYDSTSEKDAQVIGYSVTLLYKNNTVFRKLVDAQLDNSMLEELAKAVREVSSDVFWGRDQAS